MICKTSCECRLERARRVKERGRDVNNNKISTRVQGGANVYRRMWHVREVTFGKQVPACNTGCFHQICSGGACVGHPSDVSGRIPGMMV